MRDTSTNNVPTMAKGLQRFDEKDKHTYRDWRAWVRVHINMLAPGIRGVRDDLLTGQEKPNSTVGGNLAKRQRNNAHLHSVLFLVANGGATTVVRRQEGKKLEDGLGDGQVGWKALEDKYDDAVSDTTPNKLYEELANAKMKEG